MRSLIAITVILSLLSLHSAQLYIPKHQSQPEEVFLSDPLPIQTSCFNTATVTGASTVAPQQIIMWSGYANIGIQNSNSALAFIFVGALAAGTQAKNLANYPTMIWMNGGPGASSQIGNFLELGPFRYDENTGMLSWNNHTWAQNINVIFIDQPIGAGFSYIQNLADAPTSVANSTQQLYNGLVQMFTNPNGCFASVNLIKSPLFIAGESYAGKFVPAIANQILTENKAGATVQFNLKGCSIGDPFTDPYAILAQMGMFSFNLGLIDWQERIEIEGYILQGLLDINSGKMSNARDQFYNALNNIIEYAGGVSAYNIRQIVDDDQDPAHPITDWLNNNRQQLGFNVNQNFSQSNGTLFDQFAADFMARDIVPIVENLLAENFPVLIYNGQLDLIVETPGTMNWVDQLSFEQADTFRNAQFTVWKVNNLVAGYTQSAGSLTYFNINQAGHLVPADQPINSFSMITNWVNQNLK